MLFVKPKEKTIYQSITKYIVSADKFIEEKEVKVFLIV